VARENSEQLSVLRHVAALIPQIGRPLLVAIDGPDGAGKTRFADALAQVLLDDGREVRRTGIDHFLHPSAHRYAHGRTGQTVWERSFDTDVVRRRVLEPWLVGEPFLPSALNPTDDVPTDAAPEPVPPNGVLVFDGVFCQKPELVNYWDLVVFLDAEDLERVRRMSVRDASSPDPTHPSQERYLHAQRIYRETCDPLGNADVVIDNTDWSAPRIVGAHTTPWRRRGEEFIREVRVPSDRVDIAQAIDDLLEGL